jgi:hypothetical protein
MDKGRPMTASKAGHNKSTYSFTFRVAGANDIDDRLEDAIYGGGIGDALLRMSGGKVFLDFDREGDSFVNAVQSAMRDVERCASWLRVEAIEADDLNSDAFASDHELASA